MKHKANVRIIRGRLFLDPETVRLNQMEVGEKIGFTTIGGEPFLKLYCKKNTRHGSRLEYKDWKYSIDLKGVRIGTKEAVLDFFADPTPNPPALVKIVPLKAA